MVTPPHPTLSTQELAEKVDYWMTRYDQDLEMKTMDLHELKVRGACNVT